MFDFPHHYIYALRDHETKPYMCERENDCLSNPCVNGGTCNVNTTTGNYYCTCSERFYGPLCEHDVDECLAENSHLMQCVLRHSTCRNTIGNYECDCADGYPGYTGVFCETRMDDCVHNPCQNGGKCTDDIDDVICSCSSRFTGQFCATDIDECATVDGICSNFPCTNTHGGYRCNCPMGRAGKFCRTVIQACNQGYDCSNL